MNNLKILAGKVCVITGSTRGFGLAIAKDFIKEGASIVISSRSSQVVQTMVELFQKEGASVAGTPCDVSDSGQVQYLAEYAVDTFGRFDVWVNNAGLTAPYGPTIELNPDTFELVTRVNILGTYYGSLTAMRYFLKQGAGKLITVLGAGYNNPVPMQNPYASSKAWIHNFTLALAREYKANPVGVYAIAPGMMDTDMLLDIDVVAGYEASLKAFPTVVRILSKSPGVSAQKVSWLASSATDGKTGLVVKVPGMGKAMLNALDELWRSILHLPKHPINIHVTSIPSDFPEN